MASILGTRRLSRRLVFGLPLLLAAGSACGQSENDGVTFEKSSLVIVTGGREIKFDIEMADTEPRREHGLMFRKQMGAYEGMLFDFFREQPVAFWMKNTLIPLSVAFVADDGSVVNIEDMKPQTLDGHCSTKPVRYVLEMNVGWFAKRGIKAGSKLRGGPFGS